MDELLLARSRQAAVWIGYLDAYPEGFELELRASTSVPYHALARKGDRSGPDVFGRHWPIVGERRDVLPPQLLRVGVRFGDGRTATNIGGHDRPVGGPVMDALSGGGRGSAGESRFDQGYWISPLPPPGPVAVVCEWPVVEIPVTRAEIDAGLILRGAEKARAMFGDGHHVVKDGHAWRLGTDADVAWINEGLSADDAMTPAIPPAFAAYCTVQLPEARDRALLAQHERAVIEQAERWREEGFNWTLPDLMFPADRSWLLSTMWDDDWTSTGGPSSWWTAS